MRKDLIDSFLIDLALASNKARLLHLDSLGLNLAGKSVLEVGAGIGLLTGYLEAKGCGVLSTDGRPGNVRAMKKLWSWRSVEVLNLDSASDITQFGMFDVVFCYGVLYHLEEPEKALRTLSKICKETILLESKTSGGELGKCPVEEPGQPDQALCGVGCRPTEEWIVSTVAKYFEFVSIPMNTRQFLARDRFVCVGTRSPIDLTVPWKRSL